MRLYLALILILCFSCAKAQVRIPEKVDTTKQINKELCLFINKFMNQDSISNALWHPKYKGKSYYNYNMDWIWGQYTPKQISTKFDVELSELQSINDTLAYFKLLARSKPNKQGNTYTNVYKYYIVKKQGQYYIDNCKDYDSKTFIIYDTKNIYFFVSPFYKLNKTAMQNASESLDSLCKALKQPLPKKALEYYMCSNEEELNKLANIVIWNGGLTGFTNSQDGYIVGINDNPKYLHEFVHAVLKWGADCFFLQEGMATLYGGGNKGKVSYKQGVKELNDCYDKGGCNFDKLVAREVDSRYSSMLSYSFAAVCCRYIIDNYGMDFLYKLYYDKSINSENFFTKLSEKTGKSNDELKSSIESIIIKNKAK